MNNPLRLNLAFKAGLVIIVCLFLFWLKVRREEANTSINLDPLLTLGFMDRASENYKELSRVASPDRSYDVVLAQQGTWAGDEDISWIFLEPPGRKMDAKRYDTFIFEGAGISNGKETWGPAMSVPDPSHIVLKGKGGKIYEQLDSARFAGHTIKVSYFQL